MGVDYWAEKVRGWGLKEFGDPLSADIFEKQMRTESGDYAEDVLYARRLSPAGAAGGPQYMPTFAKARGITPGNPFIDFPDAAKVMKENVTRYGGDWHKALAAYVSGASTVDLAVEKYGENWRQLYIDRIKEGWAFYEGTLEYIDIPTTVAKQRPGLPAEPPKYPPPPEPPEYDLERWSRPPSQQEPGLPVSPVTKLPPEDIFPEMPAYYPGYNRDYATEVAGARVAKRRYEAVKDNLKKQVELFGKKFTLPTTGTMLYPFQLIADIGMLGLMRLLNKEVRPQYEAALIPAKQEDFVAFTELTRAEARKRYIAELPLLLASRQATTEDEALQFFNKEISQGALTDEDEQWARDLFNKMSYLIPRELPATVAELTQALRKPSRPTPVGMHLLTDQELLLALTEMYRPARPYGMSMEEQMQLYREAGLSEEEVQAEVNRLEPLLKERIAGWRALYESYGEYKAGMAKPVLPPLSFWETVKMAAYQPMMAAAEALEPWLATVRSMAGAYHIEFGTRFAALPHEHIPGGTREEQQLEAISKKYYEARASGASQWEAYRLAWENSEYSNWYKLLFEVIVDPANLIPWTHAKLAVKLAKVPILGRFLGETYEKMMWLSDIPFKGLGLFAKWGVKPIGKTTIARALTLERDFVGNARSAVHTRFNIWRDETAEQYKIVFNEAVTGWLKKPPGSIPMTPAEKVGHMLTTMKYIEGPEIKEMARLLGNPDFIPDQSAILTINKLFENLSPLAAIGKDTGFIKVPGAAEVLMRALNVSSTSKATFNQAIKIVTGKLGSTIRNVKTIARGDNAQAIMKRARDFIRNTHMTNTNSRVRVMRETQGAIGTILDGADWMARIAWRDTVERHFVAPFASNVLYFVNYGAWNVAETALRAWVGRGPVRLSFNNIEEAQRRIGHLANSPYDVVQAIPRMEMELAPIYRNAVPRYSGLRMEIAAEAEIPILMKIPGAGAPLEPLKWLEQRLFGRKWRVSSFAELNTWYAELSTNIRAYWTAARWAVAMNERHPEKVRAIAEAIVSFKGKGIKSFTNKELEEFQKTVFQEAMVSPERVRAFADFTNILETRKAAQQVATILSRDTVLPQNVKDGIQQLAHTGALWKDIDGNVRRAFRTAETTWVTRLEYSRAAYERAAKEITELEIKDVDTLMQLYKELHTITDMPEHAVSAARQAVEDSVMDIIEIGERSVAHERSWDYIREFLSGIEKPTNDIINKLKQSAMELRVDKLDDVLALADRYRLIVKLSGEYRTKEATIFAERLGFKPKGGTGNIEWWQETNRLRRDNWDEFSGMKRAALEDIETLQHRISEIPLPEPRVVQGELTVADVAYLFQATGDDISRKLYMPELQALTGKDTFKEWVRRKANEVGRSAGKTADELGYTHNALDKVWDNLMISIDLEPTTVSMLSPYKQIFDNMKKELHTIYIAKKIPETDLAIIRRTIEESADNVSKLPMYAEAAPGIREAVAPEVTANLKALSRFADKENMWISGSYTTGRATAKSDLDILVGVTDDVFNEPMSFGMKTIEDDIWKTIPGADVFFYNLSNRNQVLQIPAFAKPGGLVDKSIIENMWKNAKSVREVTISKAAAVVPTTKSPREIWLDEQEAVMAEVRTEYGRTFTDYSPGNMVDSFMHGIFPFWTYESQRFPYLWRTYIRNPGIFTGQVRYYDYSDEGYMHIPGTILDFGPMRGTVWMNALRSLYIRDYPEYLDALPPLSQFLDRISRAGFFVGIQWLLPLTLWGTMTAQAPEWGALLPSWVKTPVNFLRWRFPDNPAIKWLQDVVMPERYTKVLAIRAVNAMGIKGVDIYYKLTNNIKLTEEEQAIWDKGMGIASGFNALNEQFAVFRLNPEERIRFYEAYSKAIEELTGYPPELQEKIRNRAGITGHRLSDVLPLDPADQIVLRELEGMKVWSGTSAPLLPAGIQGTMANINEYWNEREKIINQAKENFYDKNGKLIREGRLSLDERLMKWYRNEPGGITPEQWKRERGELMKEVANRARELDNSDRFMEVPKTIEERKAFYEKTQGITPIWHPGQEIIWMYYEMEPKWELDEETGTMEWDFDTYYAVLDWMLDATPEPFKASFMKVLQQNLTPLDIKHWEFNRNFNRPYRYTRAVELEQWSPEERAIIKQYYRAGALERRELRQVPEAEGEGKLVAQFETNLKNIRRNLRLMNPELNAQLSFWDSGVSLLTPESRILYLQTQKEYLGGVTRLPKE